MRKLATCTSLAVLILLGADNPLDGDKFLQKADEKFEQTAARVQDAYAKGMGEAYEIRLKTYRSILAAATKAGDFDRAAAVKERIAEIEAERDELGASVPGKKKAAKIPKDAVKFGGHAFALFKDSVSWHVAKRRCEEMGGHLAITRTPEALEMAMTLCRAGGVTNAWLGATDELAEGEWHWIDGSEAVITGRAIENANNMEHYAQVLVDVGFNDVGALRSPFICEWDK